MKSKTIRAADLFCGAGGASAGLTRACERLGHRLDLVAVNHWSIAVETHAANHPEARHLCEDLQVVNPRQAVPGGKLDLLLAGPECTHHSTARGGKPVNDQSRASAWCVLRWATALQIDAILIENVREFASWGPLGANGRPLQSRKGETFRAFLEALRSLGYRVDWRVLNAADYGDPTTRQRLFIQAVRGRRSIRWPEPTHTREPTGDLFGQRQRWRPARDIIDWSIPGQSIFARKKQLSPNTLARIAVGLTKFGGPLAEPFLVLLNSTEQSNLPGTAKSLDAPLPTVTGSRHLGLVQPFVVTMRAGDSRRVRSIDEALPCVTAAGNILGLCQPFIVGAGGPTGKGRARSVDDPLSTVMTENHSALLEPFVVSAGGPNVDAIGVDRPLNTVPSFLVPTNHGGDAEGRSRAYSLDRPMPTVTTVDAWGLAEPFLVRFHNNRPEVAARSLDEPLPTADCNDRYGLTLPLLKECQLDIRFRMLQPHELAAAMSFPRDYVFKGNRSQKVKQIGNAWPGKLSEELVLELLKERAAL